MKEIRKVIALQKGADCKHLEGTFGGIANVLQFDVQLCQYILSLNIYGDGQGGLAAAVHGITKSWT